MPIMMILSFLAVKAALLAAVVAGTSGVAWEEWVLGSGVGVGWEWVLESGREWEPELVQVACTHRRTRSSQTCFLFFTFIAYINELVNAPICSYILFHHYSLQT